MKTITKDTPSLFRAKLNERLAEVAKEFGCSLDIGIIHYDNTQMDAKITLTLVPDGVSLSDPYAKFKTDLRNNDYGWIKAKESDLGIIDPKNKNVFIGLAPAHRKYPYVFVTPAGKKVLYTAEGFEHVKLKQPVVMLRTK